MSSATTREAPAEGPLSGLAKHSAIYSAAPLIRQLISVGMVRLYTEWLGNAGFGAKEIADLWLIALQQVLGLNVLGSMVRFYFDKKSDEDRAAVVTSATLTVSGTAWVLCGLAFLFSPQLVTPMLGSGKELPRTELLTILQLTLVLIPFTLSSMAGFYYLQILKRSALFTAIQTGKLFFEVGLNFLLIGYLGLGVKGFLISMLAGEAITSLLLTGWMLWTLKPRIDLAILKPVLKYATPLVAVGLCQLILHFADRRLLEHFSPDESSLGLVGVYGLGYKIAFLVTNMMLGPFLQIWQPWIFAVEDEEERSALISQVGTYAVLSIAVASLGVISFGRQGAILLAKDPTFWESYRIIPFIAAGYVFWALYHVAQTPLFIDKKTGRIFVINLAAVVFNLAACAWLIPRYQMVGAAIATLLTFVCLTSMMMWASHRRAHVSFELGRIGAILACIVVAGGFALWIDGLDSDARIPIWAALAAKAGLFLTILGVFWIAVLRTAERTRFRAWIDERRGALGR